MKFATRIGAMILAIAMITFALGTLALARAGPKIEKAVTHQATVVNAGEQAVQPSMVASDAKCLMSQTTSTISARSRGASVVYYLDGRDLLVSREQPRPTVVRLE